MSLLSIPLAPGDLALLQQGYRNNWQQYLASLQGKPGDLPAWDLCVLTASNDRQAEAYEFQIRARSEAGLLPSRTRFRVVPDPNGLRIGSGGATLHVLTLLAREKAAELDGKRILVIHSGGDSRRLPHCSAVGKLFSRVPHAFPDGRPSSLFDEFMVSLSGLPGRIPEGVLVASGDVLLLFDHLQLGLQAPGVVGVAAAAPAEVGTHHGVYVAAGLTGSVRAFLHKPSLQRQQAEGAQAPDGSIQIDTGLVWLSRITIDRMQRLAAHLEEAVAHGLSVNLYGDLLAPLAEGTIRSAYLGDTSDGPLTPALQEARCAIWESLRGLPFGVERLSPSAFVHFGTTAEYLNLLREGARLFAPCGWSARSASWVPAAPSAALGDRTVLVNTLLTAGSAQSCAALDSHLATTVLLGESCLLANVQTERPVLELAAGLVLHQLPLRDGRYVTRLFGTDDDPKREYGEGGTFLNRRWPEWMATSGLTPDLLWPDAMGDSGRTLWDARLYPACASREESLDLVLWLSAPGEAPADVFARWRESPRLSLAESFALADVSRVVTETQAVEDSVRTARYCEGLQIERPAEQLAPILGHGAEVVRRAALVSDVLETSIDPWLPLRGYHALALATLDRRWEQRSWSALARLVRAHTLPFGSHANEPASLGGISVQAAARIDLGGGWTDTPPYSLERGGCVLNAAISLKGRHPIVARAMWLDHPEIILQCEDVAGTLRPRFLGEVLDYANPADPYALLKAALAYYGLVPGDGDPGAEVAEVLRAGGRGLRLQTATTIPRGSGLGTSSILAGAILQALGTMLGRTLTQPQLFDAVLCLEQMITTGGGWQDQVGGLVGGIKLTSTQPGLPQLLSIEPLNLDAATRNGLGECLALVYTGQRRLAKDLLHQVMGRYMARDPEMCAMLRDIAELARAMRAALLAGDLATLGALIGQHWEINKRMDPGCSNPFIDQLKAECAPYCYGAKLAGAGGGGFLVAVARDPAARHALDSALASRFPRGEVGVWPSAVAEEGLLQPPALGQEES